MPYRKYTVGRYSTNYTTDIGYLITPTVYTPASTKVIINFHGRGGDGYVSCTSGVMYAHVNALVSAGYAVLGIDHARVNSWGDPDAMRATVDAKSYLSSLGFSTTLLGALGLSLGGQTALNEIKRNPSQYKAAWLFNPVTDLRWFHDTSAQYTPAYSGGSAVSQGVWASEINTTYSPSTTVNGAQTINGSGGPDSTLTVATGGGKSFADGQNNAVTGKPQFTVNGATINYTGKTDNTLTGCRNAAATAVVTTNGQNVTSSYATQSNGYRIWDEVASWAGITTKIKVCQASDDTTVPPGQNANDANGFVGRVNSSNVTLRSPAPTGDHINSLLNVPTSEVVDFYLANY